MARAARASSPRRPAPLTAGLPVLACAGNKIKAARPARAGAGAVPCAGRD
jgi:hypothetical protein